MRARMPDQTKSQHKVIELLLMSHTCYEHEMYDDVALNKNSQMKNSPNNNRQGQYEDISAQVDPKYRARSHTDDRSRVGGDD